MSFARLLALILVLPLVGGCHPAVSGSAATRPAIASVVIITDCGVEIDDQWTLAHLALSPELDLRGVVSTHASTIHFSSATSARCASDILQRVASTKAASVPVIAGADAPLPDPKTPRDSAGVDLLLRLSRGSSPTRRLVVLSTGAATEVASAILKDPTIADRIVLVAMGFSDWPQGGPEFNISNDPIAWQVILASEVPVVVGSAQLTKRDLSLTAREAAAIMRTHGPIGKYLESLLDAWITRNPELVARMVKPGTWVIWDEVVVAYALGLAHGHAVARPQLRADLSFAHTKTSDRITWLTTIDTDRLWRDFSGKIDAHGAPPRTAARVAIDGSLSSPQR